MVKSETGYIRAENLRKEFVQPDGQTVVALSNVNAEIKPGEFISLIGPSGCGKSTFLRLLAGLTTPDEGAFTLDGVKITDASYERGLVFQDPTLFPWLTIYDNVAFGLKVRSIYHEKKKDVLDFIRLVGLQGFEKAYPHQLSGGMAQRAALARALVNHPKVLLLDEPFGALDAFTRMNMQDELIKIWQERGTTTVMVTHDVDEAIYLSDRIFVMSPRPARIENILEVEIGRPRERDLPEFLRLRAKILQILDFAGKREDIQYYL
ncbi:NitT/TauT family transport system ATP-binding protein [Sporobacter termitidis DSM 10068]|uniref:NitT/TauT family transport system ATP-binding protein n=1 Tax=Sporobacter termitidis DSM 10068 TaxID=1123282 RepID=A0A1M5TV21_9FIRM|nr:ABC transporter ATP-binding protein [Sporobacter termitidis]SHH54521.1 NitT/TauT family transport system ATP-binding protein [Sporobacter termitidis DSM 10068]